MFSQVKFLPLFELSFYTHLGSSVASVSHLSLKFDLRHIRFIYTRQNITVASSFITYISWRDVTHIKLFEEKIGRQTTAQQPTNEWRRGGGGCSGGGSGGGGSGGGGSTAAAHSVTAAGDGWGKGKGD